MLKMNFFTKFASLFFVYRVSKYSIIEVCGLRHTVYLLILQHPFESEVICLPYRAYSRPFFGEIRLRQEWDVLDVGGVGLAECSGRPIFFFCVKENWIYAVTRHPAEPNNILLTRNLPFESDVRQWSHPVMIPLHCLWDKSNNTTRGQFEHDVTCFCFCFNFVRSFICTVRLLFHNCLRFQVVQKKHVDCKMSTKNVNK